MSDLKTSRQVFVAGREGFHRWAKHGIDQRVLRQHGYRPTALDFWWECVTCGAVYDGLSLPPAEVCPGFAPPLPLPQEEATP